MSYVVQNESYVEDLKENGTRRRRKEVEVKNTETGRTAKIIVPKGFENRDDRVLHEMAINSAKEMEAIERRQAKNN